MPDKSAAERISEWRARHQAEMEKPATQGDLTNQYMRLSEVIHAERDALKQSIRELKEAHDGEIKVLTRWVLGLVVVVTFMTLDYDLPSKILKKFGWPWW